MQKIVKLLLIVFIGIEDGIYGPKTYAGIVSYQKALNLRLVDGIIGLETISSLSS